MNAMTPQKQSNDSKRKNRKSASGTRQKESSHGKPSSMPPAIEIPTSNQFSFLTQDAPPKRSSNRSNGESMHTQSQESLGRQNVQNHGLSSHDLSPLKDLQRISTWKEFVFSWLYRQQGPPQWTRALLDEHDQSCERVIYPQSDSIRRHILNKQTFHFAESVYSGQWRQQVKRMEYQFDQIWKSHCKAINGGTTLYTTLRPPKQGPASSGSMHGTSSDHCLSNEIPVPITWDKAPMALHHFARHVLSLVHFNEENTGVTTPTGIPSFSGSNDLLRRFMAPLHGYWIRNNESTLCTVCKEGDMHTIDSGTSMVCNQCHYVMDLPNITHSTVSFGGTNKDPRGSQRVEQTRPELLQMHYVQGFFTYLQELRVSALGKDMTHTRLLKLGEDIIRRVSTDSDTPQKQQEQSSTTKETKQDTKIPTSSSCHSMTRDIWERFPWVPLYKFFSLVTHDEFWKPHNIHRNHKSAVMSKLARGTPVCLSKMQEKFVTFCLHRIERALPHIVRVYPWLRFYKRRHLPKAVHLFAGICANMGWDEYISFPPKPALSYTDLMQFEYVRMYFWMYLGWKFIPLSQPLPSIRVCPQQQQQQKQQQFDPEHYQPHILRQLWISAATQRIQTLRRWLLYGRPPKKDTDWWQIPSLRLVRNELTSGQHGDATKAFLYRLFVHDIYEQQPAQCANEIAKYLTHSFASRHHHNSQNDDRMIQLPYFLFTHPKEKDYPFMERVRESKLRDPEMRNCLYEIRDTLGIPHPIIAQSSRSTTTRNVGKASRPGKRTRKTAKTSDGMSSRSSNTITRKKDNLLSLKQQQQQQQTNSSQEQTTITTVNSMDSSSSTNVHNDVRAKRKRRPKKQKQQQRSLTSYQSKNMQVKSYTGSRTKK